jgi:hypothetical protein
MKRLWCLVAVVATGVMAAPGAAGAASIATQPGCLLQNTIVPVAVVGFAPNDSVQWTIPGSTSQGIVSTDPSGNGNSTLLTPVVSALHPGAVSYTVAGVQSSSGLAASTQIAVVAPGVETKPAQAKAHKKVVYSGAGFGPGGTVYGHYVFHHKLRVTVSFGQAAPPCGTFSQKKKLLPAKRVQYGTWNVQFDESKRYSGNTPGAFKTKLVIFRSVRSHKAGRLAR